jgi:hypothetical protein
VLLPRFKPGTCYTESRKDDHIMHVQCYLAGAAAASQRG